MSMDAQQQPGLSTEDQKVILESIVDMVLDFISDEKNTKKVAVDFVKEPYSEAGGQDVKFRYKARLAVDGEIVREKFVKFDMEG